MTNNRVFLPGLVGSTQSPGESLEEEDIKSKDSGVITFGENGKYIQDKYIQLFHESNKISISPRISHRPLQYQYWTPTSQHQKQNDYYNGNQENISCIWWLHTEVLVPDDKRSRKSTQSTNWKRWVI